MLQTVRERGPSGGADGLPDEKSFVDFPGLGFSFYDFDKHWRQLEQKSYNCQDLNAILLEFNWLHFLQKTRIYKELSNNPGKVRLTLPMGTAR